MPLQLATPSPVFNIIRLGYVELSVRDIEASRDFYVNTLGLIETKTSQNKLYLRGLESFNHHSLILKQDSDPKCHRIAYKVASENDLNKAAEFFGQKGQETHWEHMPYQGKTLYTRDPFGVPLAFYASMDHVKRKLQSYADYKGVQPMRIDHVNLFSPDVEAMQGFYSTDLGFRPSEYTFDQENNDSLWAVWLHRKGNVHDLALTNGFGPRLHHLAFWVPTALNIIHLCDLMATSGYLANLERGPGRHGISNAFFLYVRDPDGHRIELYASDYQTLDPDFEPIAWELKDAQRQTLWGHAAPKSWFEEGSHFLGAELSTPRLNMRPIIAP